MSSLFFKLASLAKGGRIEHHRTVGNKNSPKRLQIFFSIESRQRFIMTEEKVGAKGKQFTQLREERLGKSLIAIEGECERELGLLNN